MTNSDYLLKAAIKKVTEKLNDLLIEEINNLKNSILEEATRMEKEENKKNNTYSEIYQDPKTKDALEKIKEISNQIDKLNKKINKKFQ